MMNNNQSTLPRCKALMDSIRALDFAIVETTLYLDAYPDHPEALSYYHALIEEKGKLEAAYEKNCAPTTVYSNQSRTSWDWVKGPWPWEPDAN